MKFFKKTDFLAILDHFWPILGVKPHFFCFLPISNTFYCKENNINQEILGGKEWPNLVKGNFLVFFLKKHLNFAIFDRFFGSKLFLFQFF